MNISISYQKKLFSKLLFGVGLSKLNPWFILGVILLYGLFMFGIFGKCQGRKANS